MGVAGGAGKSVVWPAPARTQRLGFRSTIVLIFCLAAAALLPTAPVYAGADEPPAAASPEDDKADLDRAKAEVLGHLRASRFAEAMPSAERALRLSERLHGADARETAIAAQNLAFALRRTGRDAEANRTWSTRAPSTNARSWRSTRTCATPPASLGKST